MIARQLRPSLPATMRDLDARGRVEKSALEKSPNTRRDEELPVVYSYPFVRARGEIYRGRLILFKKPRLVFDNGFSREPRKCLSPYARVFIAPPWR